MYTFEAVQCNVHCTCLELMPKRSFGAGIRQPEKTVQCSAVQCDDDDNDDDNDDDKDDKDDEDYKNDNEEGDDDNDNERN